MIELTRKKKNIWEIKKKTKQLIQPGMISLKYLQFENIEDKSIRNCVKHSSASKEYCTQILLPQAHQDDAWDVPSFPREAKVCWPLLILAKKKERKYGPIRKLEINEKRLQVGKVKI